MLNNKIIKIEPANKLFSVTWNLGARCNYDCMYCPTMYHDDTSKHKSFAELTKVWEDIVEKTSDRGLKYKISFTGGEVTGNKNFMPLLSWLRTNHNDSIGQILLTTNGSATYKYYKSLFELVDNVSFSLHSEHVNEQKFFDCVIKLHSSIPLSRHLHVNIMDEWWNTDRIEMYCKLLTKHKISHAVNKVDYTTQTRKYPIMKGKLNLANT